MDNVTFDEVWEGLKTSGDVKERQTVETAEELARIINSLANARVNAHISQRDLAEKSGIKQSAIARMESLQVVPRLDTVIRIAMCLGVRVAVNEEKEVELRNVRIFNPVSLKPQEQYHWPASENNYVLRKGNYCAAVG